MEQLVYTGPGSLEWREAAAPRLASDRAALVRPVAVATCDLDALIVAGDSPFPPPFPVGHECVAEVVELGEEVGGLRPGQLVSVPFQLSCGECDACRSGRSSNCSGVPFMSTYGFGPAVAEWGGFLSDLVAVPYAEHMLVPRPEGLEPARVASASDNIADAWRAVAPHLQREPGAPVLVVGGAGPGRSAFTPPRSPSRSARSGSSTSTPRSRAARAPKRSARRRWRSRRSGSVPFP